MQTISIVLVILVFIASIALSIYSSRRSSKFEDQLVRALMKKDYDHFDQLVNSKKARRLVPPFNLMFIRFNSYVMRKNKKEADKIFAQAMKVHMNNRQKVAFFSRALAFYIENHDDQRAKQCDGRVQTIKGKNFAQAKYSLTELYQVLVKNDQAYAPAIKKRAAKDDPQRQISDYHLLAHLAVVKGDKAAENKYNQLEEKTINAVKEEAKEQKAKAN